MACSLQLEKHYSDTTDLFFQEKRLILLGNVAKQLHIIKSGSNRIC